MTQPNAAVSALLPAKLVACGGVVLMTLLCSPAANGQAPSSQIYTCTDSTGKRLTSDRPIMECNSREQRVLNTDGSVKRVVPPTPTTDERNDMEARDREAATERATKQEASRRDRNLLARFPNPAAHKKAREAALDDVRNSVSVSQGRLADLAKARKPLVDESEFYIGKALPAKLKQQLDANEATAEAQRSLLANQQLEVLRINQRYDDEFDRLKKLWSGAQPGSMGALPATSAPSSPTATAAVPASGIKK